MKKIILILLICSCTVALYAQETTDSTQAGKTKIKSDDSKTKIKDDKAKTKDADGKMKIKDSDDMNSDNDKMKVKDDKMKIKDAEGKVKVKGEGNMNTSNTGTMNTSAMGSGTTNTSTNVNVVTIGGWTTNPANLPVVGNNVPAEVVTTLKNKYGTTIYDIKQIRSTSGQNIYVVRVMGDAGMNTLYVGADGNTVAQ
jgi:hypothetical protein